MAIDKGVPTNLVSFCGTGVRKIAPTTLEVHYTNFTPTSNVSERPTRGRCCIPFAAQSAALMERGTLR
jgi:hypothetical protein